MCLKSNHDHDLVRQRKRADRDRELVDARAQTHKLNHRRFSILTYETADIIIFKFFLLIGIIQKKKKNITPIHNLMSIEYVNNDDYLI